MIYIVEGPDGAGKTTLVEKLIKSNPNAIKLHFSKPATIEEAFNYWRVYYNSLRATEKSPVTIFDRSWYSDMVYGPIMRGREEMLQENAELLELVVMALGGGIILYCTGDPKVLWQRCQKRGEDHVPNFEKLKQLHEKYEQVMKTPKYLPVVRYDTTARW